ncbi:hypothetical protein Ddc_19789 [Ditylenchus destructor]|nr:hypothetical protein Ddc_19789 [Ditylenchus destructor]
MSHLYSYLLRDIFSFCVRRELCHLRNVNNYWRNIIENEFNEGPYLVFKRLTYYSYHQCWSTKGLYSIEKYSYEEEFGQLVPKFVRFESTYVECTIMSHSRIVDFFKMSHVWIGGYLRIDFKNCINNITVEQARLLSTAKTLDVFDAPGWFRFLREMISGKCRDFSIVADDFLPTMQIPWDVMIDYLFHPIDEIAYGYYYNRLFIKTKEHPIHAELLQFAHDVKERFEAAVFHVMFYFTWEISNTHGMAHKSECLRYDVRNEQINAELKSAYSNRKFVMNAV